MPASASRKDLDTGATVTIEGKAYPNYPAIGRAYAELIAQERIPACRYMIKAAERFLTMWKMAQKPGNEFYWSNEHAIEVCAFIETLPHVKGVLAKSLLMLEPWQIWVLIAIYGFRWADTGDRVVTIAQLEIPRKSGKSLIAAGLALYELGPNAHIGDDLFIIAPSSDLALKVLEPMKKMVEYTPSLKEFYTITDITGKMTFHETDSYAMILPAAGKKQDGHDPKVVIADEFHSLPAAIFNVMKSAQGARPESLFLEIGSAGYNAFGVGWDERNLAIEVLEGKRTRWELFVAIWTIDDKDFGNWRDENVLRKANPNAGVSLPMRKLKQEVEEIYTNPRNKNETLRTRFNIWGLGEGKLITKDQWDACADTALKPKMFKGAKCWMGVDLASRNDMICKVTAFDMDQMLVLFAQHYVPEEGPWIDDEEMSSLYRYWQAEGWLTFTPGSFHTYDEIYADILADCEMFDMEMIAVDDREANALMGALAKKKQPVVAFRKNATNFSDPTKDIVAKATGKHKGLIHDGNPVLAWNVENTIGGYNTADLLLPKKITPNSPMKIDGFDAAVQANACRMELVEFKDETRKPNPMAERGVRVM